MFTQKSQEMYHTPGEIRIKMFRTLAILWHSENVSCPSLPAKNVKMPHTFGSKKRQNVSYPSFGSKEIPQRAKLGIDRRKPTSIGNDVKD